MILRYMIVSTYRKNEKQVDIGFSVSRGGEIPGEHTVSFIGQSDRIDLISQGLQPVDLC